MNTGTGGDLCDIDTPTRQVRPNRLAADLADVSDGAGSLHERDDSARHEPGLLWELPRSAPSRLARDEATRGRSKVLSARGATTRPNRGADPALSVASAQSAANLLGLAWRVGPSMSHRSPAVPHMFLLRIRIIPQIALTSKGGVPGCALRPRGPFGHRGALGAIRVDVGAVPA